VSGAAVSVIPHASAAEFVAAHDALRVDRERFRRECELVGYYEDEEERLELRNCRCGGTIAIVVPKTAEVRP
jgi:hypothetical protein